MNKVPLSRLMSLISYGNNYAAPLSGGSKGGARDAPPRDPNSFNFMQFLEKLGKIICWRPHLGELAPPPRGNPGFATATGI